MFQNKYFNVCLGKSISTFAEERFVGSARQVCSHSRLCKVSLQVSNESWVSAIGACGFCNVNLVNATSWGFVDGTNINLWVLQRCLVDYCRTIKGQACGFISCDPLGDVDLGACGCITKVCRSGCTDKWTYTNCERLITRSCRVRCIVHLNYNSFVTVVQMKNVCFIHIVRIDETW